MAIIYCCHVVIVFSVLFISLTIVCDAYWIVALGHDEEHCFLIRTGNYSMDGDHNNKNPMVLSGNYELIDESSDAESITSKADNGLNVFILHNDEHIVYHSNRTRETFHLNAKPLSKYWFCMRSLHRFVSSGSSKPKQEEEEEFDEEDIPFYEHSDLHRKRQVGFTYRVHRKNRRVSIVAKEWADERTGEWMELASETAEFLTDLNDHFHYVKKREIDHRNLVERTFADILTWTLMEAAMVVGVAVGQVLLFRRFLEKQHSF